MFTLFDFALLGAVLVALGSIGLARAAVYFRRTETGVDRFFSTSFTAVTLVGLLSTGVFCLGRAVIELPAPWSFAAGIAAAVGAVALPVAAWRLFGPAAADGLDHSPVPSGSVRP